MKQEKMILAERFLDKKIAIVYDWFDKWGGVERVLLTLHEVFPQADFFTSYYNPDKAFWAKDLRIKTSFIQKLPKFIKENRIASLLFYPIAFETFNFNNYDLVISVTPSFAKSVITQPNTKHICYLLTPTRFLWSHEKDYIKNQKLNIKFIVDFLKRWDQVAIQRTDKIISISETVRSRCLKYYQRESKVLYPPFDLSYWNKIKSNLPSISKVRETSKTKNFYLIVSRLESYKKVDLAIKVFNKRKENLVVVGEGNEEKKLKKIVGKNIIFLKKLTDEQLAFLYSYAQALIMPQEEDFGYVSLEAQFFGCPVISYDKGGAKETVIEGKTGIFFKRQTISSLGLAVERFRKIRYNLKSSCAKIGPKNIARFDKKNWISALTETINKI